MRFRVLRRKKALVLAPLATAVALVAIGSMTSLVGAALAVTPTMAPYGEVEHFGGFDKDATYSTVGTSPTTGLSGAVGEAAKFVYPISMAVDSQDATAPDKYAIYVLENVNPQALNARAAHRKEEISVSLEYRIQKVSDVGTVLASTTFTLESTPSEQGLHAVSLAVDGPAERVYVLTMDVPSVLGNERAFDAVDTIDAWTTDLAPAVKIPTGIADNLPPDTNTGAGELVSSATMQNAGFTGDIDGESIAVYGTGATADLALAGNKYTSTEETTPIVELIKTSGAQAGTVESSAWTDAAATEDESAKTVQQASQKLYSMSADPNGALNVSLGPGFPGPISGADYEPNMATIGLSALSPTTAVLPGAIVAENESVQGAGTSDRDNLAAAATVGLTQDVDNDGALQPDGATEFAGTLAPSVVQLAGGTSFPSELYAGLVASPGNEPNRQDPTADELPYSWKEASGEEKEGKVSIVVPSDLALRVFDSASDSLATIGNITPGGPCNLQSSPVNAGGRPSFIALAAGREGVVFALVQPDLNNTDKKEEETELISPNSSAVGADLGDQVVEFAPGANSVGAGGNAGKWQECPQPSGGFSITNESAVPKEPPSVGTGEVAVIAGTKLMFDASDVDLRGATPWAYDWDVEGGLNEKGEGPLLDLPWTVGNEFTATPHQGQAWLWPLPEVEAEFKTPGTYTEKLNLVNDFGMLAAQRTLRVIEAGKITNTKISPSGTPTEGHPVLFNASATLPQGDKVKDYHWEFGDDQNEDTGERPEAEHSYAKAGSYTVTLTITDALGHEVETKEAVTVTAAAVVDKGKGVEPGPGPTTTGPTTTGPTTTTPLVISKVTTPVTKPKPLTVAQKLANALKACKKDKAKKQRATCEKLARKKYATKPKHKPKKGATKKK